MLDNLPTDGPKIWGNRYVILQKVSENTINWTSDHWRTLREDRNKRDIYTSYKKETVVNSMAHNKEIGLGIFQLTRPTDSKPDRRNHHIAY